MSTSDVSSRVWIRGTGDYCEAVGESPPALKDVVRAATGSHVRRIGRFIQLALVGSCRCVAGRWPEPETAVYMSSARGDLETTLRVVDALFKQGRPPMPLHFVNTVSNAGCYYVARQFGLSGHSSFICSRCFALESALELASFDLARGAIDTALVGSVDIASDPVPEHRVRLRLAPETPVAEGSHWLWLTRGERPDDAVGELVAAGMAQDRASLIRWLEGLGVGGAASIVTAGQFAQSGDAAAVADGLAAGSHRERPTPPGYYDSQAGNTVNAFLREQGPAEELIHVNGEFDGTRMGAVVVRRTHG